jgi:hypothetical protein
MALTIDFDDKFKNAKQFKLYHHCIARKRIKQIVMTMMAKKLYKLLIMRRQF